MNLDPKLLDQALGALPYPVSKDKLTQIARQSGANDQIVGILEKLPDKEFNSPDDVKKAIGGLGNLGKLGDMFKQ